MKTTKAKWPGCRILKPKSADNWQGAKSSGILDPTYLSDVVWPGANYGNAFAYLWRRFGNPAPFDHYKQLCEYDLTTPDRSVGFWLSCSPSSVGMEPGYWVTGPLYEEICSERQASRSWPTEGKGYLERPIAPAGTATRRALDAIEAGMRDLLRPVFVRDVAINILGRVSDDEAEGMESAEHAWKD